MLPLIGILIRNSAILIVQIEHLREEGMPAWEAVVEATEHRMRPIMLTALAASLALIPIASEIFWGPMAYAMMGGIIVGTVLTLLLSASTSPGSASARPPIRKPSRHHRRPERQRKSNTTRTHGRVWCRADVGFSTCDHAENPTGRARAGSANSAMMEMCR